LDLHPKRKHGQRSSNIDRLVGTSASGRGIVAAAGGIDNGSNGWASFDVVSG